MTALTHGIVASRGRAAALVTLALAATSAPAVASDAGCGGPVAASGRLGTAEIPGGTARPAAALAIRVDAKGPRGVVLAGILLPAAATAGVRAAVEAEIAAHSGADVAVHAPRPRLDRRDRIAGQVATADGSWLQERLVAAGLAVAEADGGPCADALLAAEAAARVAGAGVWAGGGLQFDARDFDPAALPDYVVMRGRIETVGMSGATTYLNFGGPFADDATVRIGGRESAELAARGVAVGDLAGSTVMVRGWARPENGLDLRLDSASGLMVVDGPEDR